MDRAEICSADPLNVCDPARAVSRSGRKSPVALDYEEAGDEMLMVAARGTAVRVSPLPQLRASSVPRTYRSSPAALATSDGSAVVCG